MRQPRGRAGRQPEGLVAVVEVVNVPRPGVEQGRGKARALAGNMLVAVGQQRFDQKRGVLPLQRFLEGGRELLAEHGCAAQANAIG